MGPCMPSMPVRQRCEAASALRCWHFMVAIRLECWLAKHDVKEQFNSWTMEEAHCQTTWGLLLSGAGLRRSRATPVSMTVRLLPRPMGKYLTVNVGQLELLASSLHVAS